MDNSYPRRLVPKTTRTHDDSYPRHLVPKTTRTQAGRLATNTTRTQDNSYPDPGQFLLKEPRTCVFSLPIPLVMIERIYTLSYYHNQIGSVNYHTLSRISSWNNGMRCMSFYILIIVSSLSYHRGDEHNGLCCLAANAGYTVLQLDEIFEQFKTTVTFWR